MRAGGFDDLSSFKHLPRYLLAADGLGSLGGSDNMNTQSLVVILIALLTFL